MIIVKLLSEASTGLEVPTSYYFLRVVHALDPCHHCHRPAGGQAARRVCHKCGLETILQLQLAAGERFAQCSEALLQVSYRAAEGDIC